MAAISSSGNLTKRIYIFEEGKHEVNASSLEKNPIIFVQSGASLTIKLDQKIKSLAVESLISVGEVHLLLTKDTQLFKSEWISVISLYNNRKLIEAKTPIEDKEVKGINAAIETLSTLLKKKKELDKTPSIKPFDELGLEIIFSDEVLKISQSKYVDTVICEGNVFEQKQEKIEVSTKASTPPLEKKVSFKARRLFRETVFSQSIIEAHESFTYEATQLTALRRVISYIKRVYAE